MEEAAAPPRVTALVLSYNAAPALRRCLTALEGSRGRDGFEIIVIDNGSTDESPRLDAEFPGVTFMRLPRNFGATKALNIAMRTAAGDFIFFLAPEVIVQPDTVSALAARIQGDESIAGVAPLLVDESGEAIAEARGLPSRDAMGLLWRNPDALAPMALDLSAEFVAVEFPGRRAVMYRKFFVRALNWLDERYGEFGADLELAFQVRRSQKRILVYPAITAAVAAGAGPRFDRAALAALSADRAHGAAAFAGKHFGWLAGLRVRLGAILHVLGQSLSLRDPRFQLRRLSALLSGAKIDGNRQTL